MLVPKTTSWRMTVSHAAVIARRRSSFAPTLTSASPSGGNVTLRFDEQIKYCFQI